jgi:uncharacterized protein (DUF58 family)
MNSLLNYDQQSIEISSRRIVFALLLACIILGMVTGGIIFYRLGYLWGFIFLVSWAWLSSASRGVSLQRTIRASRAQVGQVFEEQYDIKNNSRLPLFWIELRDESPLPGSHEAVVINYMKGRYIRSFLHRTRLYKRGVFQSGPISMNYGDILGLFKGSHPGQLSLCILPCLISRTFQILKAYYLAVFRYG